MSNLSDFAKGLISGFLVISYYAVKPERIDAAPYYWLGAGLNSCVAFSIPFLYRDNFYSNEISNKFRAAYSIGSFMSGINALTLISCKLYHEKTNQIETDQTVHTNFIDHNNLELLG